MAPSLLNQVLRAVDAAAQPGQFLLTGSAVLCGSGYGYQRADGVAVVPVGALEL